MPSRKRATGRVRPIPGFAVPAPPARPLPRPVLEGASGSKTRWLGARMLPLRLFLGVTFVYAGLVKLVDPSFLDAGAPGSLVTQLQAFARDSPLAPLITAIAIPYAGPIGLVIAVGEIVVGLGALLGLAARWAAWGGFAISILFFLTASWGTHPYFYGPDLPYAAGWLTLALVGDGGLYVVRGHPFFQRQGRGAHSSAVGWSPERRAFLEATTLGVVAVVAAGVAAAEPAWLRGVLGVASGSASGALGPATGATPSASPSASGAVGAAGSSIAPSAPATRSPAGRAIGTVQAVDAAGSATFTVPTTGDPGVLVQLANGSIVAFDATCTHAGCPVEYVPQDKLLECPCHGAIFDPAQGGAVLAGPTRQPLLELPIVIDSHSGKIILAG